MRDDFLLSDDERQTRELTRAIAREQIAPRAAAVDEGELYPSHSFEHLGRAGISDAPPGHAIGLRHAVERERALIEPRLDLRRREELEVVIDEVLVHVVGQ